MQKFEIKNRYGLKIVGVVSVPEKPIGLAFVLHGLGRFWMRGLRNYLPAMLRA